MQYNYTESKIIQYLYNELEQEESLDFELELEKNYQLQEEYNSVVKTLGLLDQLIQTPNPTTIDLILEYSSSKSSLKTSKQTE